MIVEVCGKQGRSVENTRLENPKVGDELIGRALLKKADTNPIDLSLLDHGLGQVDVGSGNKVMYP